MCVPNIEHDFKNRPIHWHPKHDEIEDAENGATPAIPATPPATPAVPASPVCNEEEAGEDTVDKICRRRNGLRRQNAIGQPNFGQITSAQWALVHDFKKGEITAEDLRTQFIAAERTKLDIKVQENKISVEEEERRIAKFTALVDKLIEHFS